MQELRYERPSTVAEAVALIASGDARALAGGTDLVPQLREGRRQAARIVDLKYIADLTAVERIGGSGGWRVGAAASVTRLARTAALASEYPGLVEAATMIGSLQIQSRATLGGNLANAAPSADAVPLLIALGAEADVAGPAGRRSLAVQRVPTAPGRTALATGEIVVAIRLPSRPARSAARYLRTTPRREMDIAIAGSAVAIALDAGGRIERARIVLASVGPVPIVAEAAERRLVGELPSEIAFRAAAAAAAGEAQPISDTRGSAAYRRELVAVLTRRALWRAAADLGITSP